MYLSSWLFSCSLQRRRHDVELLCRPGVTWLAASLSPNRDDLVRADGLLQARQLCGGHRSDEVAERAAQPAGRLRDNSGHACCNFHFSVCCFLLLNLPNVVLVFYIVYHVAMEKYMACFPYLIQLWAFKLSHCQIVVCDDVVSTKQYERRN